MRDRILIIDDDVGVRKQIRWGVGRAFEVLEAEGVEDSKAHFSAFEPAVVTLDVRLTGPRCRAGLELLRWILVEDPITKVIVVTADADGRGASRAIELGAWDYFMKPVDVEALLRRSLRAAEVRRLERLGPRGGERTLFTEATRFEDWLGISPAARRVAALLASLAVSREPVLIMGEAGTGRELAARALHELGPGSDFPFTRIVGGEPLPGPDRIPAGGSIFLDDIVAYDRDERRHLLPWLDALGDRARVLASAGPELTREVEAGSFDRASYHYLAALTALLPSLRERPEDLAHVAERLVADVAGKLGRAPKRLHASAIEALDRHSWPGNFRELEKRILGSVLVSEGEDVLAGDLWPDDTSPLGGLRESLSRVERSLVERSLRLHHGNVSRAARALSVSRPTLHALIRKHAIDPAPFRAGER